MSLFNIGQCTFVKTNSSPEVESHSCYLNSLLKKKKKECISMTWNELLSFSVTFRSPTVRGMQNQGTWVEINYLFTAWETITKFVLYGRFLTAFPFHACHNHLFHLAQLAPLSYAFQQFTYSSFLWGVPIISVNSQWALDPWCQKFSDLTLALRMQMLW